MSFAKLGLSAPILQAVSESNYEKPTDIQAKVIPHALNDEDIIASAQTGSGKTASFVLPILHKIGQQIEQGQTLRGRSIRALILVPTRELAKQVLANVQQYGHHLTLSSLAIYGGTNSEDNKNELVKGIDILVATPGRLLDMAYQRAVFFNDLEFFVIDEADRMLNMGFIEDLNKIIERLPASRQSMLFSATLDSDIRHLTETVYNDAIEIDLTPQNKAANNISQWLVTVDKDTKSSLLSFLIKEQNWQQALIFVEKKHSAAKLVEQLGKRDIAADSIHAGRSQAQREKVWNAFKNGELQFLVATSVAA